MAELTTRERLQPCLLDRLTDEDPESTQEGRDRRVMSPAHMRRALLRDLEWLLNTGTRASLEDLEEFPFVLDSVINYGVPDFCGSTGSGIDPTELERQVTDAIRRFEPRIVSSTLAVNIITDKESMGPNMVSFEIRADVAQQMMSDQLYIQTDVDLETANFTLGDGSNG